MNVLCYEEKYRKNVRECKEYDPSWVAGSRSELLLQQHGSFFREQKERQCTELQEDLPGCLQVAEGCCVQFLESATWFKPEGRDLRATRSVLHLTSQWVYFSPVTRQYAARRLRLLHVSANIRHASARCYDQWGVEWILWRLSLTLRRIWQPADNSSGYRN
jgi:hypothetical protein